MTFTKDKFRAGRRDVLKAGILGGIALAAGPTILTTRSRAAEELVIRDPGGPYTQAYTEAFYKPFAAETGIAIRPVTTPHDPLGLVKAQVDSGTYNWDIAVLSAGAATALGADYLEPLDNSGPEISQLIAGSVNEFFVGVDTAATIFAYRTDTLKGPSPESWADFWNRERTPGRRGLRKFPVDTLEEAAMAGGVDPKVLYPLDLDLAFKKLDDIKPDVAVWWSGGAQSSQILKSGEIDLCAMWSGRAQVTIDEGAPAKIVWNQGLYVFDVMSIPKGNPKADLARRFIKYTADPKRQAAITQYLPYGPTHPDAFKFITEERARVLPTHPDNLSVMINQDPVYWGKGLEGAIERFNGWIVR